MRGVFNLEIRMKRFLILFLLIFSVLSYAQNQSFRGKVVGITDGDTFKVLYNKKEYKIRLAHIDAPEKRQAFGSKAKQYASDLCFGKEVLVRPTQKKSDRYGRIIAEIIVGKVNVNKSLVNNGLAWHFKKYSKSEEYALLENDARKRKVGIWSEKNPIAPWDWRKGVRK